MADAWPGACVAIDTSGRIVLLSECTTASFGYETGGLIGQTIERRVPLPELDRHAGSRQVFMAAATARPIGLDQEVRDLTRAGLEIPVEVETHPDANVARVGVSRRDPRPEAAKANRSDVARRDSRCGSDKPGEIAIPFDGQSRSPATVVNRKIATEYSGADDGGTGGARDDSKIGINGFPDVRTGAFAARHRQNRRGGSSA